jgi:O-acetyl-ADP-ribose deacetylase (regulator of RNase III)
LLALLPQAFCSISTGVYGYPIEDATRVALDTTRNFLSSSEGSSVRPRPHFPFPFAQDPPSPVPPPPFVSLTTTTSVQLDRVIFVTFSAKDEAVYRKLIPTYFPAEMGVRKGDSGKVDRGAVEEVESESKQEVLK